MPEGQCEPRAKLSRYSPIIAACNPSSRRRRCVWTSVAPPRSMGSRSLRPGIGFSSSAPRGRSSRRRRALRPSPTGSSASPTRSPSTRSAPEPRRARRSIRRSPSAGPFASTSRGARASPVTPRGTARALADEAIDRMKLASLSGSKLGAVATAARRGAVIAAALATGAAASSSIEDPTAGSSRRDGALVRAHRRPGAVGSAHSGLRAARRARLAHRPRRGRSDRGRRLARGRAQGAPAEIAAGESAYRAAARGRRARVRLGGPGAGRPAARRRPTTRTWTASTIDLGGLRALDFLRIAAVVERGRARAPPARADLRVRSSAERFARVRRDRATGDAA